MKVNEKYTVERVDAYNIAIAEHYTSTKGKSKGQRASKVIGYYSSWESAFNRLLNMSLESNSVRAWNQELKKTKAEILEAINNNRKELK